MGYFCSKMDDNTQINPPLIRLGSKWLAGSSFTSTCSVLRAQTGRGKMDISRCPPEPRGGEVSASDHPTKPLLLGIQISLHLPSQLHLLKAVSGEKSSLSSVQTSQSHIMRSFITLFLSFFFFNGFFLNTHFNTEHSTSCEVAPSNCCNAI